MAMTIVEGTRAITGGVDTHLEVHVAAALDPVGGVLGVESSRPQRTVNANCWRGWPGSDRSNVSGWKAPVRMGRAWDGSSPEQASTSITSNAQLRR